MKTRAIFLVLGIVMVSLGIAQKMPFGITGRGILAMYPDVKKELKITKDQDRQIQQAVKELGDAAKSGNVSFDFSNPMGALDPALEKILNDDQRKRLDELCVQANGGFALIDQKIATALHLTEEQTAKMKSVNSQANSEALAGMQHARSQGAIKELQKKHDEYGQQMVALLTAEQAATFESMKGKPFKFKT